MQEKEKNTNFSNQYLKKKPKGVEGHINGHATNTFFLFSRNLYIPISNLLVLFLYILLNSSGMIERT